MRINEIFKRLGLPKHADVVYKTLRKHGSLSASDICREARLYRPAIYRAIKSLLDHSFIFVEMSGKRKTYHAAKPALIASEFIMVSGKVSKVLALKSVVQERQLKEIRFLNGFDGIRQAFDDVVTHLPRGATFYRYTSERDLDAVNKYLSKSYRILRDRKKLERLVISNPVSGRRKRPRLERFVKFISSEIEVFDQNFIQLIYGDRVSLIDLNNERVVIIQNQMLADFQKVIFQQLYKSLPLV